MDGDCGRWGAGNYAGFTWLAVSKFAARFTSCLENRLAVTTGVLGQGIAPGAASQAASYEFDVLYLEELVSFATATNEQSRRLIERLQFEHDSRDDFNHPKLDQNHPLSHYVLYRRKRKEQWAESV